MNRYCLLIVGTLFVAACSEPANQVSTQEEEAAVVTHVADADEQRVIDQVSGLKTADGATVLEVLQRVEKLRPDEFKFSEFVVAYGEDQSEAVMACYFIGSKRLEDDAYCDIGFEQSGESFVPSVGTPGTAVEQELTTTQLMKGRDAFLKNIDTMYQVTCVDSGKKYC